MAKQWWIKLDIGAWEQDVNCLSLEAEGALLKLTFKLSKQEVSGSFCFAFDSLSNMFKTTPENARKIIQELHENNILDITFLDDDRVQIVSRRIKREAAKSLKKSENGKLGGRPRKQSESKTKAKQKQSESEPLTLTLTSYSDSYSEEKGGAGGKNAIDLLKADGPWLSRIWSRFGIPEKDQAVILEHWERSRIVKAIVHDTIAQARADLENFVSSWIRNEKDKGPGITTFRSGSKSKSVQDEILNEAYGTD